MEKDFLKEHGKQVGNWDSTVVYRGLYRGFLGGI